MSPPARAFPAARSTSETSPAPGRRHPAPASGAETRKKIKEEAVKTGEKAKDGYEKIAKEAEKGIKIVKEKTQEGLETIKDFVERKKEDIAKKAPEEIPKRTEEVKK